MKKLLLGLSVLISFHLSAQFSIALPEKPTDSEKMAAQELAEHFEKATGKAVPIVNGTPSGKVIYIGTHPEAVKIAGKKNITKKSGS